MRPCFYLSNAFAQSFGMGDRVRHLLSQRAHSDMCSVENFSFTTAAVRFSNGLSKDEVFTSLRAIIQGIGEHASKHSVRIDFGVGTLFLGKQRNQFVFNKRLRVLVEPHHSHELDAYTEVSGTSRFSSDVYPDDSASVVSSSRRGRSTVQASQPLQLRSCSEATLSTSLIPGVNRQESAYIAALQRHLSDLELRASEAMNARKQWDEHLRSSKLLGELEEERRRKIERDNAHFLLSQIKDSSNRKKNERREEIDETNRLTGFPKFSELPQSNLKVQAENIRKQLDNQVYAGKSLRSATQVHDREIALKLNEVSRRELEELEKSEAAKKHREKDLLCESWNRDIKIKNSWKTVEQYDMIPEKHCLSNVGVLLPHLSDDSRSQVLGGSCRRTLTGNVRKR